MGAAAAPAAAGGKTMSLRDNDPLGDFCSKFRYAHYRRQREKGSSSKSNTVAAWVAFLANVFYVWTLT